MDLNLVFLLLDLVAVLAVVSWALMRHRPADCLEWWRTPAGRANALLRQILGEEEYRHFVRHGYLDVPSPTIAGRIYRVPHGPAKIEVIEAGVLVGRLCAVPTSWVPAADVVITHKLLIEGDEARYLLVANHFPPGGGPRIGRWYP